jgi:predicted GNAT family N-acyltransferase
VSVTVELAGPADAEEVRALRHRVFVVEQQVPVELEQDELDATAIHAVARTADGTLVGTGRAVVQEHGVARIGRMAVAPEARGGGVGALVLARLEQAAAAAGCREAELHAQVHALGFYARAGYAEVGERFEEAGIPHVAMRKALVVA